MAVGDGGGCGGCIVLSWLSFCSSCVRLQISQQLKVFKDQLEVFAAKHKNDINKNPVFRRQFQKMCTQVGVDPLASTKGFWAELLGVGDFYYELAVQVIDVCMSTQRANGGTNMRVEGDLLYFSILTFCPLQSILFFRNSLLVMFRLDQYE